MCSGIEAGGSRYRALHGSCEQDRNRTFSHGCLYQLLLGIWVGIEIDVERMKSKIKKCQFGLPKLLLLGYFYDLHIFCVMQISTQRHYFKMGHIGTDIQKYQFCYQFDNKMLPSTSPCPSVQSVCYGLWHHFNLIISLSPNYLFKDAGDWPHTIMVGVALLSYSIYTKQC